MDFASSQLTYFSLKLTVLVRLSVLAESGLGQEKHCCHFKKCCVTRQVLYCGRITCRCRWCRGRGEGAERAPVIGHQSLDGGRGRRLGSKGLNKAGLFH